MNQTNMSKNVLIALMLAAMGCNSGDIQPPSVKETDTDGGLGDTGASAGSYPSECWTHDAPENAVRWQCQGLAEAAILGTLDIEVNDSVPNSDFIQSIIDYGRFDWSELFGPWDHESYDDPGVDACCLPDIARNDGGGGDGADETGAPPPEGFLPQAAWACASDCADQACRFVPDELRRLAEEVPPLIPLGGKSYRKQIQDLANWTALHHEECYTAMTTNGATEEPGGYVVEGTWQISDDDDWPVITGLSVEGKCKVFDWLLPEEGEPHRCTGINDNNNDGTFDPEGGGSSFGGFDTFVSTGGEMRLDGPVILGVDANGSAPLLGLEHTCPRGECSRVDAWITAETLELRRMVLMAPSSLTWEVDGLQLTVDELHGIVEHPRSIPLRDEGDGLRFEIPPGELEVMFAGRIHGVPVTVSVPNGAAVTGTVTPLVDGTHDLTIDPIVLEYQDSHGAWTMEIELEELVALEHSPRASFDVQDFDGVPWLDAAPSYDPDGNPLALEWFVDGEPIGKGSVSAPALLPGLHTVALRASDGTGRSSWSHRVLVIES